MSGIVVGVDGSEGAGEALAWAAEESRRRQVPLDVVLAWQWPVDLDGWENWVGVTPELVDDLRELARQRLDRACAAVPALEELDAERTLVEGPAATALVDAAQDAELLVVGTRGHGGFAGLLLGSVSQQCAHHSPCPIVIVPPRRA